MKSLRFAAGLFCLLVASELRAQGPLYLPSSPAASYPAASYAQSPISAAPATNSSGYYFAPSSPNSTTRIGSSSSAPTLIVSSSPTSGGGRVTTTYAPSSNSTLPSSSTTVYYAPTSNNTASTVGSIDTRSNVSSFKSIYPVTTASYSAPSYSTPSYAVQSNAAPASSSVYTPASTSQVWSNSSYGPSISPPTQVANNEVRYSVPADYAPTLTVPSTTTYPTSGVQYYPATSLPNTVYRQTRSGSSCQPGYGVNSPASLPPSLGYGVPANNSPYKALLPLQKMPNNTYVGQGLIGQPKAFVEGQPVRNFFRYILP